MLKNVEYKSMFWFMCMYVIKKIEKNILDSSYPNYVKQHGTPHPSMVVNSLLFSFSFLSPSLISNKVKFQSSFTLNFCNQSEKTMNKCMEFNYFRIKLSLWTFKVKKKKLDFQIINP